MAEPIMAPSVSSPLFLNPLSTVLYFFLQIYMCVCVYIAIYQYIDISIYKTLWIYTLGLFSSLIFFIAYIPLSSSSDL